MCTGDNSRVDITRAVQVAYDLPDPPGQELAACFAKLTEEGLIR
jgi:hypothetical protein